MIDIYVGIDPSMNSSGVTCLAYEDGKLIGADDFKAMYAQNDPKAFVADTPPTPASNPVPTFVQPTVNPTPAKPTLTQMMQWANEHPDQPFNF